MNKEKTVQQEVDERTNLTGTNKFEMLLFRLGAEDAESKSELFGINVFKVREIVEMPEITAIAGAKDHLLGVVNIRGQIIPVIDMPALVGCKPKTGLNIMLVTEFARSAQAFAVESVEDIARLDWNQVLPAERGIANEMVTSIARLDDEIDSVKLVQVLDVETILQKVSIGNAEAQNAEKVNEQGVKIPEGSVIVAADDSAVARTIIEQGLEALNLPYVMTKSGKEAWEKIKQFSKEADEAGVRVKDKVALVLTDLEMPEMDGFTLTKNIKTDMVLKDIPVVIHSSLTGAANEAHVRGVGADGYVAKFEVTEFATAIKNALSS